MPETKELSVDRIIASTLPAKGYAALAAAENLKPFDFERRIPGPHDVLADILYCGICHTDLHFIRNDWGMSMYPMVPGHEIVGRVTEVGDHVKKFKVGDAIGIGCLVDSCRECDNCKKDQEQYCQGGFVLTYSSYEKDGKTITYGGYSNKIVVDENYVLKVSDTLPLEKVAPLLCAGITTYSPLRHWKVEAGHKVGILGLGGLGHMAVKFASAFGAEVTVLSSSPSKEPMVCVGLPTVPAQIPAFAVVFQRRSFAGSLIGGIAETQEMLDYCAANDIAADVEVINIKDVNTALERMERSDVKYRFVIDMATI